MATGKTISNPGGLYGLTADTDTQTVVHAVVATTAALPVGDIVAVTSTGVSVAYTTMTTLQTATTIFGVVSYNDDGAVGLDTTTALATYAVGTVAPIVTRGVALINVSSFTIAVGDLLSNSSIAGAVQKTTATTAGINVAVALATSTQVGSSAKLIPALIKFS